MSAGQLARRSILGGGFKKTPDSELWRAAEVAMTLTENPALKDALARIAKKLKDGDCKAEVTA